MTDKPKVGRPTKYTIEMEERALAYVSGGYQQEGHIIPSISGMALTLDISRETLYAWSDDEHKGFSDILAKILNRQEKVLIAKGLMKTFDSGLARLGLGKHGYHEKVDNTHTGKGGGPIQTIELVPLKSNKEEGGE